MRIEDTAFEPDLRAERAAREAGHALNFGAKSRLGHRAAGLLPEQVVELTGFGPVWVLIARISSDAKSRLTSQSSNGSSRRNVCCQAKRSERSGSIGSSPKTSTPRQSRS